MLKTRSFLLYINEQKFNDYGKKKNLQTTR